MPLPPPPDAAYADRARASFSMQGVMHHLGASLSLVAPARGELLRATGRVERAGRTLTVVRGEVEALTGGRAVTVALMQGTMMRLAAKAEGR